MKETCLYYFWHFRFIILKDKIIETKLRSFNFNYVIVFIIEFIMFFIIEDRLI